MWQLFTTISCFIIIALAYEENCNDLQRQSNIATFEAEKVVNYKKKL